MNFIRISTLMIIIVMRSHSQGPESMSSKIKDRLNAIFPSFSAYGFNLDGMSANSNVVIANSNVIIIRYGDRKYFLVATYDFDPQSVASDSRIIYDSVKVLVLKHSLRSSVSTYHKIPSWLRDFKSIECLVLDDVFLEREKIPEELRLKYLGFQNAEAKNTKSLIQAIGKMNDLEFLHHRSLFTPSEINKIKRKLPNLTVLPMIER